MSVDADRTDPGAITSELVFILYYRTVCYGDRSVDADRTDLSAMTSELVFIYYRTVCYSDRSVDKDRTNTSVMTSGIVFILYYRTVCYMVIGQLIKTGQIPVS